VSTPTWFCTKCDLRGSEKAMRAHSTVTDHKVGAHEVIYLKPMEIPLEITSIGATGAGPKDSAFSYVHANWCPVLSCLNRVLQSFAVVGDYCGVCSPA
jgi:hypothetical protein